MNLLRYRIEKSHSKFRRSIGKPFRGQVRADHAGIIELVCHVGEPPALRLVMRPENDCMMAHLDCALTRLAESPMQKRPQILVRRCA
jgi:hypothetical protein